MKPTRALETQRSEFGKPSSVTDPGGGLRQEASPLPSLYFPAGEMKRVISTSRVVVSETEYFQRLLSHQSHSRHGNTVPTPSLGLGRR